MVQKPNRKNHNYELNVKSQPRGPPHRPLVVGCMIVLSAASTITLGDLILSVLLLVLANILNISKYLNYLLNAVELKDGDSLVVSLKLAEISLGCKVDKVALATLI